MAIEKKDYIYGTILIAMLIAGGIVVAPTDNYYSEALGITMKCDRLSGTEKTCYPLAGTTVGKKYSKTGWQFIDRDEPTSVEPEPRIVPSGNAGKQVVCKHDGCR